MKQKLTHLIAILALVVGGYGLVNELLASEPAFGPAAEPVVAGMAPEPMVRVWHAAAPLKRGDNFAPEQFAAQQRFQSEAGSALLDLPYGRGAVLRRSLAAGELLGADDLITPDDPDYINAILRPGMTPFPLAVEQRHLIAARVQAGDYIDILALTSLAQNMAQRDSVHSPREGNIDVQPLLSRVRVLAVQGKTYDGQDLLDYGSDPQGTMVTLVLEIPHRFISKMTLARRLSALEIYKSHRQLNLSGAQTKDILPGYQGIVELRGSSRS